MNIIKADMTSGSEAFTIKALDLMHGQVIRSREGRGTAVSNIEYVPGHGLTPSMVQFDLVDAKGVVGTVSLPQEGGNIVTWLPIVWTQQAGMDPQTERCGTCDSRHCGHDCTQPYVLDRA